MRLELTLPALERLLGGDTEIEVHLRQQIVEEFARKHLKTLLNDTTWKRVHDIWKEELRLEIEARLKELIADRDEAQDERGVEQAVRWNLRERVRESAQAAVDEEVKAIIDRQNRYFVTVIQRAVQQAMETNVNKAVEEEIQRRLTAAKEAR